MGIPASASAASTTAANVERYDGLRPPQQLVVPRWKKQGTENATRSAADDGNKAPENEAWIQEEDIIIQPRMQPKVEIPAPRQDDEQTEGNFVIYYDLHWQKKQRLLLRIVRQQSPPS